MRSHRSSTPPAERTAARAATGSLAAAALVLAAAAGCHGAPADDAPDGAGLARLEQELSARSVHRVDAAARLFDRHCAVCHGVFGRGDGPASFFLFPPARDFSSARFRLVSTANGVPTERDLVEVLRRGMPGSAMPSWRWLQERELRDLADYVRLLAVEGIAEDLAEPRDGSAPLPPAQARRVAERAMTPGPALAPAPAAPDDEATRARGRELFAGSCAGCHGAEGRGLRSKPVWNEDGTLNWARDFTAGVLKGEAFPRDVANRIRAGMPGSSMPGTRFDDPADLAALVAHVCRLIPDGSESRLVQRRRRLLAPRAAEAVPTEPQDPRWGGVDALEVVLAPLWWQDASITSLRVAALHDGERIALHLSWADDTPDDRARGRYPFSDAAAVQLSAEAQPPLFGMGSRRHPTDLWHWRAIRYEESMGALDLLERPGGGAPGPRAETPPVRGRDAGTGAEQRSAGILATPPDWAATVAAQARWSEGRWEVVLVRALDAPAAGLTTLLPGSRTQIAFAVWNGAAGDLRGQKSISIWQELALAP